MIDFLKHNKLGRATFLPLTSIVPRNLPEKDKILNEEGVIGIANDLVQPMKDFSVLADHLLGKIVVVDHMDHALRLAKKYHYSLRIVTLEGESLSPGGSISGGTFKNNSNLLGRHREMDEMRLKMEALKNELAVLNKETDAAHDQKRSNKRRISMIQDELQQIELKLNTLYVHIKELKSSESSQSILYRELSSEFEELKHQTSEIDAFKKALYEEQTMYEFKKSESENSIEGLNIKLEEEVSKQQIVTGKTAELGIDFSSYVQKQDFLKQNLVRTTSELKNLEEEMKHLEEEIEEHQKSITEKNLKVDHMLDVLENSDYNDEEIHKQLGDLQITKEKLSLKQKKFFSLHEELSTRCSLLDKEIFRLNHDIERSDDERNKMSNYMWEEYALTYISAIEMNSNRFDSVSKDELSKRIIELKKEIKNLGHINLNAIEEFKEVSERYELLKSQHDDLVYAEEKLSGIIIDLDQAMREQFKKNFVIIQQNFKRVFAELFGGGKGTLELMEDADLLDAGIRIIAQPPGKKLQNMMQLSGGEKALTAIALLFAIQSLKPSPFCLLDEIEAALDDANVKRYARYLNNLTEDTQFIIITHRRGTMNAADVLYGVTMQEKGVSALVSVNLIENELTK